MQDVLQRMDDHLVDLRRTGDDRRIFLAVYRTMTGAIHDAITAGRFVDPVWAEDLTARFALLYFDAAEEWASTGTCAAPWAAAFAVAGTPRVSAVEHALLGINAHIVYDLPRAVAATMRAAGDVTDGDLPTGVLVRRRHDYEVVNHVLAETVDAAQDLLAGHSRVAAWLDVVALRLDEYAAEMMLRVARTQGWHISLALAVARDEHEEEAVRAHLDRIACGYVERIDLLRLLPTRAGRALGQRIRPPFGPPDATDRRAIGPTQDR
jgi:hypothetical protein